MRGHGGKSGGVVVFTALSMTCLIGVLALATGEGMLSFTSKNGQTPADLAIMLPTPLNVAMGKVEFGGFVNAVNEATDTARAGGANGVENLLAASPIRGIASYPLGCITNYLIAGYSLTGRAVMGDGGHHEG